jgi:hypothetical protein
MQKISCGSQKSDEEYFRLQNFVRENRRDREHLGKLHSRFMYSGLRVGFQHVMISTLDELTRAQFERQDFDAGSWARSLYSRAQHQAAKKERQGRREDTPKAREQPKAEREIPAGIDEVSHLKGCKIAICVRSWLNSQELSHIFILTLHTDTIPHAGDRPMSEADTESDLPS